MNAFKSLGVALVVCLSLLVNVIACVLIALSLEQPPTVGDADVVITGVGNSGNSFTSSSKRRLAKQAIDRNVAPEISDATLKATVAALVDRAAQGDTEAAAFVFELGTAQRETEQPRRAPATGAVR